MPSAKRDKESIRIFRQEWQMARIPPSLPKSLRLVDQRDVPNSARVAKYFERSAIISTVLA